MFINFGSYFRPTEDRHKSGCNIAQKNTCCMKQCSSRSWFHRFPAGYKIVQGSTITFDPFELQHFYQLQPFKAEHPWYQNLVREVEEANFSPKSTAWNWWSWREAWLLKLEARKRLHTSTWEKNNMKHTHHLPPLYLRRYHIRPWKGFLIAFSSRKFRQMMNISRLLMGILLFGPSKWKAICRTGKETRWCEAPFSQTLLPSTQEDPKKFFWPTYYSPSLILITLIGYI